MDKKTAIAKLPTEVAQKYVLTSTAVSRKYYFKPLGWTVDLNVITLEEADKLKAGGFPYIKLKESRQELKNPKRASTRAKK